MSRHSGSSGVNPPLTATVPPCRCEHDHIAHSRRVDEQWTLASCDTCDCAAWHPLWWDRIGWVPGAGRPSRG